MKPDDDLDHLYPPFALLVNEAIEQANKESFTKGKPKFAGFARWGLFEGYRSVARQEALYQQGRTTPGAIVTNSKTPNRHGFGLAADIVWYDTKGRPHWDGDAKLWEILGHCARAWGLVWGGNWAMRDLPHVELPLESLWKTQAKAYLKGLGLSTP